MNISKINTINFSGRKTPKTPKPEASTLKPNRLNVPQRPAAREIDDDFDLPLTKRILSAVVNFFGKTK